MENALVALSNELAAAVEKAGQIVVAVHGRPRASSSGVLWKPGVVVTAEHTLRREEDIRVTLPDGKTVPAEIAGRDPGTDLAVLRIESGDLAPVASWRDRFAEHGQSGAGCGTLARYGRQRSARRHQHRLRPVAHLARREDRPLYPARCGPLSGRIGRRSRQREWRPARNRHRRAFAHVRAGDPGADDRASGGRAARQPATSPGAFSELDYNPWPSEASEESIGYFGKDRA